MVRTSLKNWQDQNLEDMGKWPQPQRVEPCKACHTTNSNTFFIQEKLASSKGIRLSLVPPLSQATIKVEEYHDLLKSTEAWIENTSRLLANPADYDSSQMLSHHASTLQVSVLPVCHGHQRIRVIISGLADPRGAFFP